MRNVKTRIMKIKTKRFDFMKVKKIKTVNK